MDLARKDISHKLMIFGRDRKKWQKNVMFEKKQGIHDTGEEGSGSGHSFAR